MVSATVFCLLLPGMLKKEGVCRLLKGTWPMTILYLDAVAGISGDMTVAALLELGLPLDHLNRELALLGLPQGSFALFTEQVERQGMTGLHLTVQLPEEHHHHHHRSYGDIRQMIAESSLNARTKELAQQIFLRLAEAEGLVHRVPSEAVTFHEVGALDSIVDIVAVAIGLDYLQVEELHVSAVPLGGGFVETAHGRLPVPAPATAELLKGFTVHGDCPQGERVTPTGAAILAALAKGCGAMPPMRVKQVGHGAGTKDFSDCPNILRAFLGSREETGHDTVYEAVCNLDDVTPEQLGYTMERLLQAGALDVWYTAIQMKKNRPGVQLSLLCTLERLEELLAIIKAETGTLGIRINEVRRLISNRQLEERQTGWGMVRFKRSAAGVKAEYEDCRRIAREQGVPLREIQRLLHREYDNGDR